LHGIYKDTGVTAEYYPKGVYVYWRDGFYVALNYSSENYAVNLPEAAKILIKKTLRPSGVQIRTE
jgi:beta-galactosidase